MLNEYKNATTSCIFIQTRKIAVIARVFGRFPLKKGRGNAYCTTIMQPILYIKCKEKASTFFKRLPHKKDHHAICTWSSHHSKLYYLRTNYLRVTFAPTSSSLALMSSAVALSACSLTILGALSTTSLASLSPRPVTSRTTLITLTFSAPTSVSSTSNSVFSSPAAAPSPAAAATTTPAAADTPNSSSHAFTKSFNSNTDN